MKKIMFAAIAALAITSCSQNEEFENDAQKEAVGFTTMVSKSTRATELVTDGLKSNGGFKVYGYITDAADMGSEVALSATPFMPGNTSIWSTDQWVLTPAGPYYWPTTGKIQFFAFSPFADVTYSVPDGTTKGYPTFEYTIKEVASQTDLVVAHAKNQTKDANGKNPVSLAFKHALTQVNFQLKGQDADYTYKVNSITLSGLANQGTFQYNDLSLSVGVWTAQIGNATYVYTATYSDFTSSDPLVIKKADNALMLMPQNLGTGAKIIVDYSTKYEGKTVFNGQKEVSLDGITWNPGNKILYTLSLTGGGESVTFDPTVDNWNEETNGGGDKNPK